jgi:branched-chain amino acid transport system permease protein
VSTTRYALRPVRVQPSGPVVTIAVVVAALIGVTAAAGPYILINSLVTGGMWALMAAGLALVFGVMNIPNFAHGEFFMIGSLVGYFTFQQLQPLTAGSSVASTLAPLGGILAALLAGGIAGVIVERGLFYQLRRRNQQEWVLNSFLLTVGLSVILMIFGTEFRGITQYWDVAPLDILGTPVTVDRLATFIIALVTIVLFWLFLRRSRLGRAIRATAQDETGAVIIGINPNFVYAVTMALSCAMAALAGASLLYLFPAYPTVGLQPLYIAWFVVILAGLGNIPGAIVGGFIVAFLETVTAYYIGETWVNVVPTALIIVILLFKPSGLFGSAVRGVWER